MKIVTVETKYYLFKPHKIQTETSNYYYVKVVNQLTPEKVVWVQGYVNHMGGVSTVGPSLSEKLCEELEAEFQEAIKTKV